MSNINLCLVLCQFEVKSSLVGTCLTDKTLSFSQAYAETDTVPGHYVLFWKYIVHDNGSTSRSQVVQPCVFKDCCLFIEKSLNRQGV